MLNKLVAFFKSIITKIANLFGGDEKMSYNKLDAKKKWKIKIKKPQPGPYVDNKPIDYLVNDYSTPDLRIAVDPPKKYPLSYDVKDYEGGGHAIGSAKGKAANVFVTITNTLRMMEIYSEKPFTAWPGTSNLIVLPIAGNDLNAFYNRKSMQFFFAYDPVDNIPIYTCDSADIVSHELGHAILDSFRPDTWSVASLEVWSFHEAWADLTALLSIMQHDEVLEMVLAETKGDLRLNSIMTRLAESMGRAVYNITNDTNRPKDYLRSTINNFKYVNPGTLPEVAPDNQLAAECHSFGRIFLGAFYDILEAMYHGGISKGMTPIDALKHARDTLGRYAYKAIQHAPMNMKAYESMAKTMLWVAWNLPDRPYHDEMKNVFLNRNIIKRELRMLTAPPVDEDQDGIVALGHSAVSVKLSEHIIRAQGQDDNNLYDIEAIVAEQQAYLYDKETGVAIDFIGISQDEVLEALQDTIIYLHQSHNVSSDPSTPFEVVDGKLVRTHFS